MRGCWLSRQEHLAKVLLKLHHSRTTKEPTFFSSDTRVMQALGRLPFLFIAHQASIAGHGHFPNMPARTTLRLTSPAMAGHRIHGPLLSASRPRPHHSAPSLRPARAARHAARPAPAVPAALGFPPSVSPAARPSTPAAGAPRVSRRSEAEVRDRGRASVPFGPRAPGRRHVPRHVRRPPAHVQWRRR